MKEVPFADRPMWQRVKDLQMAAGYARMTLRNVLPLVDHADRQEVREALRKALNDVIAEINNATGQVEPARVPAETQQFSDTMISG